MNSRTRYRKALLTAALAYAERGWHVFPLRPGTKKPAVPNHPAHLCDHTDPKCGDGHTGWEQRATTNHDRIKRAWTTQPYGIGIATGPSGLSVIDLDTPQDPGHLTGRQRLEQIERREQHALPATLLVATPSGGQHLYFNAPDGSVLSNTASLVGPYIDTRANGGYVVAPPTQLDDGRPYEIRTDHDPLPVLPAWFAALLDRPRQSPERRLQPSTRPCPVDHADARVRRYVAAAVDGETQRVASATPGTRNNTLFTASVALGQLVATQLLTSEAATQALSNAAGHHLDAGAYTPGEAAKTIASGLARGEAEPRQIPNNLAPLEPAR